VTDEPQVRRQIAREIAAYLDKKHAPPIWQHCVDIADPTYCIECPTCNNSWDGCSDCDHGFITDAPIGGYTRTEHQ
jgi:hypothetical protein